MFGHRRYWTWADGAGLKKPNRDRWGACRMMNTLLRDECIRPIGANGLVHADDQCPINWIRGFVLGG
jgi:hypothetical protein